MRIFKNNKVSPSVAMSMAIKNLTKDTVTPRTGTFLHKTELDSKKVRPRILLNYQSIDEVQAYCWRTCNESIHCSKGCISSLCILGGDHGIGAFHLPPRTLGGKRRKQNKNCLNYIQS